MIRKTEHTDCGECSHNEVCNKKNAFERAKAEINNATTAVNDGGIFVVRDVDWISVDVKCGYFLQKCATVRTHDYRGVQISANPV